MPNLTYAHGTAIFIGRFQPFHLGHLAVLQEALNHAARVVVLIGSARSPRCHRNPFTYAERERMIRESVIALDPSYNERLVIKPLDDMIYNDEMWIKATHNIVSAHVTEGESIALIGHAKDRTSYYRNMFPSWTTIEVPNYRHLNATTMRAVYFSDIGHMWLTNADGHKEGDLPADKLIPKAVKTFLGEFLDTPDYNYVAEEYAFIARYRQGFASLEYPPTFVTVDACVVQSGHVLLVRRRLQPGKRLWALPGGFIKQDETILEATIRELREETRIRVPEPVLYGSIKTTKVFDDPFRSARGRTITHASLIHLRRNSTLPAIRGSDDAEKAKWFPIGKVEPEFMFEDHISILQSLVARL